MAAGAIPPPLFFGRSPASSSILAPARDIPEDVPKHRPRRSRPLAAGALIRDQEHL